MTTEKEKAEALEALNSYRSSGGSIDIEKTVEAIFVKVYWNDERIKVGNLRFNSLDKRMDALKLAMKTRTDRCPCTKGEKTFDQVHGRGKLTWKIIAGIVIALIMTGGTVAAACLTRFGGI